MSKKKKQKNITPENVGPSKTGHDTPVIGGADDHVVGDKEPFGLGSLRNDTVWLICCGAITVLAFFLRFYWLGLKPFHHDEGVNGWFLTTLFRDGIYRYDPANYHGPTLYYITLAFSKIFGMETLPVRWSVAVWGFLIVMLTFFLRRYIGRIGALAAAAFLALSPGMVYISRYFIHEIFFVFLALGFAMAAAFFIDRKKAGPFAVGWTALLMLACFYPLTFNITAYMAESGSTLYYAIALFFCLIEVLIAAAVIKLLLSWNEGRGIYLILATACVSLMFATKETSFITLGTMAIAVVCVWIWRKLFAGKPTKDDEINDEGLTWKNFVGGLGQGSDRWLLIAACIFTFIYIFVLFFSSFFTYSDGIKKAFEAYAIWTKTGTRDHANGFWAYLNWMWKVESPIIILSAVGTAIAFFYSKHRFAMFAGLWTLGLFIAYSLIPYKTPWLALSFMLPACIVAGYAVNVIASIKNKAALPAAALICAAAFGLLGYKTYELNFVRYDDDQMTYVYAHTRREFLDMTDKIEHFAKVSGKNEQVGVDVVSPEYWPMVWYMKDRPKVIFHARLIDNTSAEMLVARANDQKPEVLRRYAANYRYAGSYALRPGVDLMLLVRKDLAPNETKEIRSIADMN